MKRPCPGLKIYPCKNLAPPKQHLCDRCRDKQRMDDRPNVVILKPDLTEPIFRGRGLKARSRMYDLEAFGLVKKKKRQR